jgi:hypothetical protein
MSDDEILGVFGRRRTGALFVTELAHALRTPEADLDADLERLAERGAILIAEHPVPDPHLAGIDLRIVAPLASGCPRPEAEASAAGAAETLWSKWLASFLSSHRCH